MSERLNYQANEAKKPPKPVGRKELSRRLAECFATATPDQLQAMADELKSWAARIELPSPAAWEKQLAEVRTGYFERVSKRYGAHYVEQIREQIRQREQRA
jgi:hypothetical protein